MPLTVTSNITASVERINARVEAAALEGTALMGHVLEAHIKGQIQGGHKKGTKTGAHPGGPPENVTGTLRRSVITNHPRWLSAGVAETQTGPTTVYSRAVDQGHPRWKSGVKYPYVEPGAHEAEVSGELHAVAFSALAAAVRGF